MPYVTSIERFALEKGRQEGFRIGFQEGRREEWLRALEAFLTWNFKQAGAALLPAIRNINDDRQLETILEALVQGQSLDELTKLIKNQS